MSAYIVEKQHIIYLVESALATCRGDSFRWYWSNPTKYGELPQYEKEKAADVANMLWRENIKSVSHRYPNESSDTLPGTTEPSHVITADDFKGVRWLHFDPTQVIKACDCYDYQSCEHDGWKQSEAHAFTEYLRARSWTRLPGYDGAAWGPPAVYENAANVVSLMDLARGDAPARFRKA